MPSIILGLVLSSLYGLVFYLLMGHGWLRLLVYWVVGVGGFFLGQFVASVVGLSIFNIGDANIIEGTVASILSLIAVYAWMHQKPNSA
jgi:hypothetical protein